MKRRASTISTALLTRNQKRPRSGKTYFDLLPFELLVKVIRVVQKRDENSYIWPYELVHFGNFSERFRKAVIEALRYKLDFSKDRNSHCFIGSAFPNLAKLFDKDLREINLVYPDSARDGALPNLTMPIVRITSLRKASIAGKKKHLELIYGNKHLTHLEVTLCAQFRITWKSLTKTLRSLPLRSLRLHVSNDFRAPSSRTLASMANACREVTTLSFGNGYADYTRYWGLIVGLHRLERLAINGNEFGDEHMKLLRKIPTLKVSGWIPIDKFVPHTSNVLSLQLIRACSKEDVSKLSVFRNLRHLSLKLEEGAETALTSSVYNLEALQLEWRCHGGPPQHQINVTDNPYYHANRRAIIQIIRNATQLRDLALIRVYLPINIVVAVMKIMGKKLRSLHTHIDMQLDHPARRLGIMLCALGAYCPKVEKLEFSGACNCIPLKRGQKSVWLTAARIARDRCPDLDMTRINSFLSSLSEEE